MAETMKVSANFSRSLAACASFSSFSLATISTLLMTRILGWLTVATLLKIASASSSMPSRASSSTQTRSASCAPLQAVDTMARSSRRFGMKMPGVSTRMIWALLSITMPRISARVVCTLRETMVTLEPTSALTSVDLPTLGAPISATKPQRVAAGAASPSTPSSWAHPSLLPPPTPSRSIITDAATFSAARLLPPTPSAGSRPGKSTATRNCGS